MALQYQFFSIFSHLQRILFSHRTLLQLGDEKYLANPSRGQVIDAGSGVIDEFRFVLICGLAPAGIPTRLSADAAANYPKSGGGGATIPSISGGFHPQHLG